MKKTDPTFSGMGSLSGFVLDPVKCSRLSLHEKRELVYQIAQQSKEAPEILSSFTRRELLEIICAEMGKVRKYTGFTKSQMIEHLMKLILRNTERGDHMVSPGLSSTCSKVELERERNKEGPNRHQACLNLSSRLCQNAACRATLGLQDAFCKRCSCCICYLYDDNKDPSLWLTCGSDLEDDKDSCGMSSHLQCALNSARTGITKNGGTKLDGQFYCVSCGRLNGLMGIWRKQLLVAKDARRVDELCLRISLAQKILLGTEKFEDLQKIVTTALWLLKEEVGPVDVACTKLVRGLVNRLSCGSEVHRLCASAVEKFDSLFSDSRSQNTQYLPAACKIHFEEVLPTSVIILLEYEDRLLKEFLGCRLWHRPASMKEYPEKPTFIVLRPDSRFKIVGLCHSTEYMCKVSVFSSSRVLGFWEAKWVTPTSSYNSSREFIEVGGRKNAGQVSSNVESISSTDCKLACEDDVEKKISMREMETHTNKQEGSYLPPAPKTTINPLFPRPFFPATPCKFDGREGLLGLSCKRLLEENDYEYSVRVVKWLENQGHINEDFRVKFLTWFSLKATLQERKVVSVFVDTLIDDPQSLASQLIDSFMDEICFERKVDPEHRCCSRLWH